MADVTELKKKVISKEVKDLIIKSSAQGSLLLRKKMKKVKPVPLDKYTMLVVTKIASL
jgi:hypothetical protein